MYDLILVYEKNFMVMVGFSLLYGILIYAIRNMLSIATGHGYIPLNTGFTMAFLPHDSNNGFGLRDVYDSGFDEYVRREQRLNAIPNNQQISLFDYYDDI